MSKGRLLKLRRQGSCVLCSTNIGIGTEAWWDAAARTVTCVTCMSSSELPAPDLSAPIGRAGTSAAREYTRRSASDESRIRARFKRFGGLIWTLSAERTSTRVWSTGAEGERIVGEYLDRLVAAGSVVLHDVRFPGERANVDHIVVVPSGIHIIDTKLYREKKIIVRRTGSILARTPPHLFVGGRDQMRLVEGLKNQVVKVDKLVRDLRAAMQAPVTPVLCFVYADWGWPRMSMSIDAVRIVWPKALVKLLRRPGPLTREQIEELGTRLATSLLHD